MASAGIVGLALSFAAQDTLGNLFAGIAIVTDKPYRIGDYIVLDSGERGEVTHIGLRSTRLLTRDDVEISIPNGIMGKAKIVNESGGPHTKYRVRVAVGVAYGSDIDQVIAVLMQDRDDPRGGLPHPEPRVRFRQFGSSSLDLELLCWIEQPALRGVILHELNCEVYRRLAARESRFRSPSRMYISGTGRGIRRHVSRYGLSMPNPYAIAVLINHVATFYLYTRSWVRIEVVSLGMLTTLLALFFVFPVRRTEGADR